MFQMASVGPMMGQAHHFVKYNPDKSEYASTRYLLETKRLYKVIDERLADNKWLNGDSYSIADMAGGMYTALGVLGSLVERSTSGLGQRVDVAMLDAQVALLENAVVRHLATGEVPGPIGTRHPLVTPFQAFATLDGHLVIAGVKDWELFCAKIDRDDLITDDRFQTNADRTQNHGQLEPLLIEVFATRTTTAWIEELTAICLIGPVNTIPDLVQDPQIVSREMVVQLPYPRDPAASLSVSNSPVKLSRTPVHAQGAAPRAGQHSLAILRQMLDLSEAEVHALVDDGVTSLDSAASDV